MFDAFDLEVTTKLLVKRLLWLDALFLDGITTSLITLGLYFDSAGTAFYLLLPIKAYGFLLLFKIPFGELVYFSKVFVVFLILSENMG